MEALTFRGERREVRGARSEITFYGVPQLAEYLAIVLDGRGLLFQDLVVLRHQSAFAHAVLVDMLYPETPEIEAQTQIVRPQYVVKVGNSREMLRRQTAIERVEPLHTMVLIL